MPPRTIISNERLARETEAAVAELDDALSSESAFEALVAGLPPEVIEGVRRSLRTERAELSSLISAYVLAKSGDFSALRQQAGNDPGAFLIAARLIRGFSQKDLARKLGLREQNIQRWEAERYRSITLANYQKVAHTLGVKWRLDDSLSFAEPVGVSYDLSKDDFSTLLRHARVHGWLSEATQSDDSALATLIRHVGDHVTRYGVPSLLRTGLRANDRPDNWLLLSWKAQVTRRAEGVISSMRLSYKAASVSWLIELVKLSSRGDGPKLAVDLLKRHGIVLIFEPQIVGMALDGASFLIDDVPVIGMTLLHDTLDNFWFTLLHEVAHVILHYHTGLAAGFFDEFEADEIDEFEREANAFASNMLIPDELWTKSPVRISKTPEPIERLADQLGIHPAIIFGRVQMERKDYKLFANRIGRGELRKALLPG